MDRLMINLFISEKSILTDVLGCCHWIVVLIPASNLMVIDRQ